MYRQGFDMACDRLEQVHALGASIAAVGVMGQIASKEHEAGPLPTLVD
jgi:hypothetical protein